MINLITLLIGMILVSVIVACLIVFKIHGSIQDVLKTIADLQSSMDMRLRIRHIEMLKAIYAECIKAEDYEGAEKLREVIKKEGDELNEIYGS